MSAPPRTVPASSTAPRRPRRNGSGLVGDAIFDAADEAIFWTAITAPTYTPDVDNDGNGTIGRRDYRILRNLFGGPPGPSGLACAGTVPCPPWL